MLNAKNKEPHDSGVIAINVEEILAVESRKSNVVAVNVGSCPFQLYAVSEEASCDDPRLVTKGVYEGGSAVWECSLDLTQYLISQVWPSRIQEITKPEESSCFIEVGCGLGLPLITCLMLELRYGLSTKCLRSRFIFQDLNAEVLLERTIPNIIANLRHNGIQDNLIHDILSENCCFVATSWKEFARILPQLICGFFPRLFLASECTYRVEDFPSFLTVCNTVKECNKVDDEVQHSANNRKTLWLLATKRYYFGVGGGTYKFLEAAKNANFAGKIVHSHKNGLSNIRDILALEKDSEAEVMD